MGHSVISETARVLVIDDEDALRSAYERVLRAAGMTVSSCPSGEAAIALLQRGERFEAIVTDLVMSGISGVDLMPVIRQFDADVPIVIITGRPSLRSSIAAMENGSFRYLLKPVSPRDLSKAVRDAVARYRLASLKLRALEVCENEGWRSPAGTTLAETFDSALRQLYVAYQPIVSSDSALFGYEALVRTGETAFAGPDQLFDAAERLGRVQELGRKIRLQVSDDMAKAPLGCTLFVNLHASDLGDSELCAPESALTQHASRVILEVTERKSLGDFVNAQSKINALRELGYRIAVDDLGAGYAGLSCVNMLEPDIVKLDMSLIRGIDASPRKRSLVESMIRVCQKDLGVQVVCEGVETVAEAEVLVESGTALLQGYFYGRPQREFVLPASLPLQSGRFLASAGAPESVAVG